jgi:hypothetical protein
VSEELSGLIRHSTKPFACSALRNLQMAGEFRRYAGGFTRLTCHSFELFHWQLFGNCQTSLRHIHRHKAVSRDRQKLAVMQSSA